ncbi:MAG: phosphate acyltransferase PlsX [Alphaproteobacteria bacterium]
MSKQITIAVDAMGGDRGARMVIRGCSIARKRYPDVNFILFGDKEQIAPLLERAKILDKCATVRHALGTVGNDTKPSTALRSGRDSSMWQAIASVRAGEADAAVSAGNTGALMALAKFILRTMPQINRPAMASFFPTLRGESVMLDLGANVECDADNLVQFAVMGELFARTVLGRVDPTVGLLNIGAEELKGHESLRQAAQFLRETKLPIAFHGFIEGNDIAEGTVDVIVTDGFTGNIALKTAEGTARLVSAFIREAFKSSFFAAIGYLFARHALKKMRRRVDPRSYNGAVLLGLNGIVVKSHGGSDPLGFATAMGVGIEMATHGFIDKIRAEFAQLYADGEGGHLLAAVS